MIYTVSNTSEIGRPCRVFVNGNEVRRAVYADTNKGIVRYVTQPIKVNKMTGDVYTRKLKGVVTVELIQ